MTEITQNKIIEYLESRMALKNEVLKIEGCKTISFSEFMQKYKEIEKRLSEEKDKDLENLFSRFKTKTIEEIMFTESEIASLMTLIKKALQKGLSERKLLSQTEKNFIRKLLHLLSETEQSDTLEMWMHFFEIKQSPGLIGNFSGSITVDGNSCSITNFEDKLIYCSDRNGIVSVNVPQRDEGVLIASNLFYGILHKYDSQIHTVFLKQGDGFLALDCDYETYYEDETQGNYVEIQSTLNEYLIKCGYTAYVQPLYDKHSFNRIINVFDALIKIQKKRKNRQKNQKRGS